MRNRLLTVICILSLALTLVACGSNEDISNEAVLNQESETNIVESDTSEEEETTSQETTEAVKDEEKNEITSEITSETEESTPEIIASGKLSDASIEWKIIGTTLYVSGTGAIPDFSTSPATVKHFPEHKDKLRDWQFYDEIVEKIVIEDGITKLGKNNFAYFKNTTEIIFADSVVEIGKWSCTGMGLESIDFNNITKLNDQSFGELLNMTTLRIPGSLETISAGCFAFCNNLQEVYIEEGVKTIQELAFTTESGHWNCSIHLPESITDFPSDTFNHDTTIYVKAGSKAEKLVNEFASRYNITVIVE